MCKQNKCVLLLSDELFNVIVDLPGGSVSNQFP